MDWTAKLLNPIYLGIGVAAQFTPADEDGVVALTVIDKTAGIDVGDGVSVSSVKPAAVARVKELTDNGLTRSDLSGGSIEFGGNCWTIETTSPKPSPGGEADGELYLILTASNA